MTTPAEIFAKAMTNTISKRPPGYVMTGQTVAIVLGDGSMQINSVTMQADEIKSFVAWLQATFIQGGGQ